MITLTRDPVRISTPGTFALPGMPGASYTYGHDAVMDYDFRSLPGEIGVDIEGCGLTHRARLDVKAVQFGTTDHALLFDPRVPAQFARVREILSSGRRLVLHNSPFDIPILAMLGMMDEKFIELVIDTLVWARMCTPDEKTRKSLHWCANKHLGMSLDDPLPGILKKLGVSKQRWFSEFDLNTPNYRHMAAADPILTARLRPVIEHDAFLRTTENHPFSDWGVTGQEALNIVEREQILNRNTLRRNSKGIRSDLDYLDKYREETGVAQAEQIDALEAEGITPGHSASMTSWLDKRGLIPEDYPKTAKTKLPSGSKDDLKMLDHPLAKLFLVQKEVAKTEKDYLDKVAEQSDVDGRIHPECGYFAAATGRSSYKGPPVQQFSPGARGILVPDDYELAIGQRQSHELIYAWDERLQRKKVKDEICHCKNPKGFTSIDFSQIEPCLAANVAGDLELLAGYESGRSDLYTDIAMFAKVTRKVAKVIVLAQLYGEGLIKLARDLGLITGAEALKIQAEYRKRRKVDKFAKQTDIAAEFGIDGFIQAENIKNKVFAAMPETTKLVKKLRKIAGDEKLVFTVSGRILPIPSGWFDGEYSVQTHKGTNYFCQGGAYDILADSLLRIHKAGLADAVYWTMHDELIVDSEAAPDVRRIMETPPERLSFLARRTPVLKTDVLHLGERWGVEAA